MKTTLKNILFIISLFISSNLCAQSNFLAEYKKTDSLLKLNKFEEAYIISKNLAGKVPGTDTLHRYFIWQYTTAVSNLEQQYRMKQDWKNSLLYATEALKAIENGKKYFDFSAREYWMYKNMVVANFGLNKLDEARVYQDKLYKAYKDKTLPDGLDEYYNFEFFKWDDKNVWGYEWYPELGDPETQGSFSKIVYYVYSTNADGTDKEQLYRLHVLKFHKMDNSIKFDYVLTKRLETATREKSGTLYTYTYQKPIDYVMLRADIKEVLKGNYQRGTQQDPKK